VRRWFDLDGVPGGSGTSVATFGIFDGVHLGHQRVLNRVVELARQRGSQGVAITFDPHPSVIHGPQPPVELIVPLDGRLDLMEQAGLDAVLTVPYTPEFSQTDPETFVRRYLVEALGASDVIVGKDVRFGRGNTGDLAMLSELGERFGFATEGVPDLPIPADAIGPDQDASGPDRVSSTCVRKALQAGDVAAAAVLLGRPHRLVGRVVHGAGRGRTLGFPTANLGPNISGLVPADGVYAGWMTRLDSPAGEPDAVLGAAVSIGSNPTFAGLSGPGGRVEAHAFGTGDLDLYGHQIALDLVVRLRSARTFPDAAALIRQIGADIRGTHTALGLRWSQ
jgi:riboflavin kinase/FMN adenylyltransferase